MGAYTNGVYVPTIGEVGWGDELNAFLAAMGNAYVDVTQAPYGADPTGVLDSTTAIQAAVDDFAVAAGLGSGYILVPGTFRITDTIDINKKALVFKGRASQGNTGVYAQPGAGSTFFWDGSAGIPMFEITDCRGVHFEDILFQGNQTNVPSELIYYRNAGGAVGSNEQLTAKRCQFGASDFTNASGIGPGTTATHGIRFGGTNGNNDQFHFEDCQFYVLTQGLTLDNSQSIWGKLDNCFFNYCFTAGIETSATLDAANLTFNHCGKDFRVNSTARVTVHGYYSEHSGQLCYIPETGMFQVFGGNVLLQAEMGTTFIDVVQACNGGGVLLAGLYVTDQIAGSANLRVRAVSASNDGQVTILGGEGYLVSTLDIQGPASGTNKVHVLVDAYNVHIRRALSTGQTLAAVDDSSDASAAHGSLPTPANYAVGARYYCTTDKKPVWSDGSAHWVDAAGANHT